MQWKSTKGATIEPGVLYAVIKHCDSDSKVDKWDIVEGINLCEEVSNPAWLGGFRHIEYYDIYLRDCYLKDTLWHKTRKE